MKKRQYSDNSSSSGTHGKRFRGPPRAFVPGVGFGFVPPPIARPFFPGRFPGFPPGLRFPLHPPFRPRIPPAYMPPFVPVRPPLLQNPVSPPMRGFITEHDHYRKRNNGGGGDHRNFKHTAIVHYPNDVHIQSPVRFDRANSDGSNLNGMPCPRREDREQMRRPRGPPQQWIRFRGQRERPPGRESHRPSDQGPPESQDFTKDLPI